MRLSLALALAAAMIAAAPSGALAAERPLPWLGLRLGGLAAVGSAGDGTQSAGGVSAYALFDGREFLADVAADVFVGDQARLFALGLGAYYPFRVASVTPYLGGGLKVGWTRFGGDGAFGIIPFAAAGLVIGREGYIQVRAEVAWFFALAQEEREDRPGEAGTHAHGPMATLGLAF